MPLTERPHHDRGRRASRTVVRTGAGEGNAGGTTRTTSRSASATTCEHGHDGDERGNITVPDRSRGSTASGPPGGGRRPGEEMRIVAEKPPYSCTRRA